MGFDGAGKSGPRLWFSEEFIRSCYVPGHHMICMEVEELILENNCLTELDPKCFELLFSNLEEDQREV